MAKRLFAGFGVLLCLALLGLWWLDLGRGPPHAAAQVAPAEIPVTPGVVTAKNVPVYLQGIGTVQAFNIVTVKTRVDGPIVKVAFTEGRRSSRVTCCSRSTRVPTRRPWRRRWPPRKGPGPACDGAGRSGRATAAWSVRGFQTRQSFDDQQRAGGAASGRDQGRRGADRHRAAQPRLTPRSARRSTAARAPAWSISAICVRATANTPAGDDHPDEADLCQLHAAAGQPGRDPAAAAEGAAGRDRAIRRRQDGAGDGKLSLIDNMIDQATGTILLKATFANEDEKLWPGEFVSRAGALRMRQRGRHGAVADGAARPGRRLCLCHRQG